MKSPLLLSIISLIFCDDIHDDNESDTGNIRDERQASRSNGAAFSYTYQLGAGGYASFSLPSVSAPHPSSKLQRSLTPAPLLPPTLHLPQPAPSPTQPRPAVLPTLTYQTNFGTPSLPPPAAPPVVTTPPAFHASRPDPVPPRLHPANNPLPPPQPPPDQTPPQIPVINTPAPLIQNSEPQPLPQSKHHVSLNHHNQPLLKPFTPATVQPNLKPFPPFRPPALAAPPHPRPAPHTATAPHHQVHHSAVHHSSVHPVHPSRPVHPLHPVHPVHQVHPVRPVHPVHHPPAIHSPVHPAHHPALPLSPVHSPAPPYVPPPYSPPAQAFSYDPFEFQQRFNNTRDKNNNQVSPPPPPPPLSRQPPASPRDPPPPPPAVSPPELPLATPFPPVVLQPVPGPGPPPPSPPPGFDDNFPEYDAVPANLGPLIPAFIPIKRAEDQDPSYQAGHRDDPAEFLFTANRNFGLATSERAKRKNPASKMTNSHGGPLHPGEATNSGHCSSGAADNVRTLVETFPLCSHLLGDCGLQSNDTRTLATFGRCLNMNYPGTVTLNLGRTLSSGHGSVSFSSDGECTQFVHSFFPSCGPHLASCTQVETEPTAARLILGCLFSQYTSLMVPLLAVQQEENRDLFNII